MPRFLAKKTLAALLFPVSDPEAQREIDTFRIEYEQAHGATDLRLRYTSVWPKEQQKWLIENDPQRYFEGLPPFAKAWIKGKFIAAGQAGNLDDMPDEFLELFLKNKMRLDPAKRGYYGW